MATGRIFRLACFDFLVRNISPSCSFQALTLDSPMTIVIYIEFLCCPMNRKRYQFLPLCSELRLPIQQ